LAEGGEHGTARECFTQTARFATELGVENSVVFLEREHLAQSLPQSFPWIVTNLRGVRPIDLEILSALPPGSVVASMCEQWEIRPQDIDLVGCRAMRVPVVTTNEDHPLLLTMSRVGLLALKLLLESGAEVADSRIVVVGSGRFPDSIANALLPWVRDIRVVSEEQDLKGLSGSLGYFDAVVVADHEATLGHSSAWDGLMLAANNLDVPAVNISGLPHEVAERWNRVWPERKVPPRFMTQALDGLGTLPVVRLHVAGLAAAYSLLLPRESSAEEPSRQTLIETVLGSS